MGVTTDLPDQREKELLGTKSPIKISIVKAWTSLNARKVESMLHTILALMANISGMAMKL
ncbi:GIY-YIG nuclease family protein [Halomonas sp. AOP27-A1-41]|uniref:GIY-YIG nuclease family protein n=1 Tax=Halomonas sp. AOP27-A1-41 TaxID=3457707 RepID=UPI0040338D57